MHNIRKLWDSPVAKWCAGTILGILFVTVMYSFCTIPYTGDIQVFMAAANQVKYQSSNGLMAIFEAWELKGIGNRLLIYVIYSISDLISGFSNTLAFERTTKVVYWLGTTAVLLAAAALFPGDKKQRLKIFLCSYFAVFATYTAAQLQAEMSCVVLCILIVALMLHGKKWSDILSGVLGSFLLFFKSVFFLLYFAALLCAFLYDPEHLKKRASWLRSLCAMGISQILLSGLVYLIYPQEFRDMAASSEFQRTLFSANSHVSLVTILTNFCDVFTQSCICLPFLLLGALCALCLAIRAARDRNWTRIALICASWLIPVDIIIASNTYFIYHYFLLMLPCIVCIAVFLKERTIDFVILSAGALVAFAGTVFCWLAKDGLTQIPLLNYSTVLLILFHLAFIAVLVETVPSMRKARTMGYLCIVSVCAFFWMNYSSFIAPKYRNLVYMQSLSHNSCSSAFPEDFGDEPVLFLDGGTAPYYADAPSYSRYFFNLPIQRRPAAGTAYEISLEEKEKLMNYTGKYIVYSSWFGLQNHPDLQTKINSEYVVLEGSGFFAFSPDWNLFSLSPAPDLEEYRHNSSFCILVRK